MKYHSEWSLLTKVNRCHNRKPVIMDVQQLLTQLSKQQMRLILTEASRRHPDIIGIMHEESTYDISHGVCHVAISAHWVGEISLIDFATLSRSKTVYIFVFSTTRCNLCICLQWVAKFQILQGPTRVSHNRLGSPQTKKRIPRRLPSP